MIESHPCRTCETVIDGYSLPILLPGHQSEEWPTCEACSSHPEAGSQRTTSAGALDPSFGGPSVRVAEVRRGLERQRLVRGELREIEADLKDATAASARSDWAGALEAVRIVHGRAVITRRALEGMLGSYPVADLPPLVRVVQAVGRLITDQEIDSLRPDELRDRMHAVLRVLDHELQTFLEPPEDEPVSADADRDALPGGVSAPERP
jgi:hypothetical protein